LIIPTLTRLLEGDWSSTHEALSRVALYHRDFYSPLIRVLLTGVYSYHPEQVSRTALNVTLMLLFGQQTIVWNITTPESTVVIFEGRLSNVLVLYHVANQG
jgi:hypothetical protein